MGRSRTFALVIEPPEEAGGYFAYFPSLPGCHTWGDTYQQAVLRAEEALLGYLEALSVSGQQIPAQDRTTREVSLGVMVHLPTIV